MRRNSREIAFQILFQSDFAPAIGVVDAVRVTSESSGESHDAETLDFAKILVEGVQAKKTEIDNKIQSISQHWKMDRMASVDRNLLRLAVFEMLFSPQPLKPAIAINEAVEMAKKFGSTESASFVNGILDQIGRGL
jgi:transcription antitermination protein NusB